MKIKNMFFYSLLMVFFCCGCDVHEESTTPIKPIAAEPHSNLYTKYKPLLEKAFLALSPDKDVVAEGKIFSKSRLHCDTQVLPWITNALDAEENGVPYTAMPATSGMSNYKEVPATAKELIVYFIKDKQLCGIPHYIERMEYTLDPSNSDFIQYSAEEEGRVRKLLQEMKDMLAELKRRFA